MKENINRGSKNLSTDTSLVDQPKDTTRFVLNGVVETVEGDRNFVANEEANEECYLIPDGYILLGKVYMNDNKQAILSVAKDETSSEIGLVDNNCTYTTIVNADLGFKVSHQIDVTYRLRRGCEDTIYFVTPIPMIFNFSKLDDFKDDLDAWDVDKFRLTRRFKDAPIFESILVEENGNSKPGSYNAAIQYLDNDLNPTEWITSCSTIKIYNDNLSKKYAGIRGSTGKLTDYQKFGNTNKSIKFTFSNIDLDYPFYRIAIIASNNGDGVINEVGYSQEISTEVPVFNYTGPSSIQTIGTVQEIQAFASIIEEADYIDQIDNKLLLVGTKGKQINFCKLQKYASRIKADLTTKEIILNAISDSNPKSPTAAFEGTGYMPGEIHSFGIVYEFDDGDISPVFHIPGRSWDDMQPIETAGYYSLMSDDNACVDTFYTDNSSCEDYWGKDSEGDDLLNQPVRHHRFPLRSEVNKPLFTEEPASQPIDLNQLALNITGVIDVGYTETTVDFIVEYEIDGNISFYESSLNVATYDDVNGLSILITTSSSTITINNIFENGSIVATPSASTNLTYATIINPSSVNVDDKVFKSEIFGIKFSGITVPPKELLDGREIIGYYIVRNERDEDNKSILDTGVLAPLLEEPYFVAHGHIMPNLADTTRVKEDAVALIHPEHRFGLKEYTQTTKLIKEGEYRLLGNTAISSVITQDVMAGTSYDSEIAKRRERDNDGFSLHTVTRDNEVEYKRVEGVFADETTIEDVFYLDALNSKVITDVNEERKEIFNVSGDNKIGIVQLNQAFDKTEVDKKLPYVVMKRELSNPYGNFRVLNYYKETQNRIPFILDGNGDVISGDETSVFHGDVHVTPLRYHTSLFYDIRLRKRASKKGVFNIILGALAIIAGVIVSIYGGATLGVALIGFGVSSIATGIKKDQIAKVYSELYDAGLRDAVDDDDTTAYFGPNPEDDEVQWLSDTVTNLWFESTANMGLRQGATHNMPDFLDSPSVKAQVGVTGSSTVTYFGINYTIVNSATSPQNELDSYMLEKLTLLDADNENGRLYKGYSSAEIYEVNPDYRRINKEKVFFHLGIEYDCCSECIEEFPGRVHHSEQAFQEELTDNYRVFLPNNYKDLEGEKGRITNVYRLYNSIYIHTEEALWHLPQNYQERVTGDIVSFIGTGSYFDTPPRRMVDADGSSAGTKHNWGTIKTKYGILFPNEAERKWYLFDGKTIKAISDDGNSSWFKANMGSLVANQYYASNGRPYPFLNNPSSKIGEGFLSTYDSAKERLIVTKKDYSLSQVIQDLTDYELCLSDGEPIIFYDFQATIDAQIALGFEYVGMDGCEMKFIKVEYVEDTETRTITTNVSNTADIHVFYDTSGSFGDATSGCLQSIKDAVADWQTNFAIANPDWTGTVYEYNDGSERWVNYAQVIGSTTYSGQNLAEKDIIVISFVNEASSIYHDNSLDSPIPAPTSQFTSDYNDFVMMHSLYKSFAGIHYPIVFGSGARNCSPYGGGSIPASKNFLLHSIAALKGIPMTISEAETFSLPNPAFTTGEWITLKDSLKGVNPYPDTGLDQYGWVGKWDRAAPSSGPIIDDVQFQEDITELLEGIIVEIEIEVTVQVPVTTIETITGTVLSDVGQELFSADNSWTMSYSLKDNSWVGWHSYRPNFYLHASERFYGWMNGIDNIYKFGKKGQYQTYFGQYYPHIVEFVSVSSPLTTRIWDYLKFNTEARQYSDTYDTYVDKRHVTHNKVLIYNTRQCSGILSMIVKDETLTADYLQKQVDNNTTIVLDRNERDWSINDLRDIRVDYDLPMFNKSLPFRQPDYYIDKVINLDSINTNKHWAELENFRDKFLVVRFIFDNFDDIQLITNYSIEYENQSPR